MGKRWADALRLVGIGWYIALCIVLGTLGGRWIGQRLDFGGSEALFTVLGLLLGLVVAFLGVYRMLRAFLTNEDNGSGSDS
jgi:ATP synthase protein I